MRLVDPAAEFARGEPLSLAVVLIAAFSELGAQLTPGDADSLADTITRVVTLIVGIWLARRHTTPLANPVVPTRDSGDVRVGDIKQTAPEGFVNRVYVPKLKPVITLRGKRAA